jgi:hypothetical protein
VAALRALLDRHTLTLTDSELERRFLPIARRAGLPPPLTQREVNGLRVEPTACATTGRPPSR